MNDNLKKSQEQLMREVIEDAKLHGVDPKLIEMQINKTTGQIAPQSFFDMHLEPIKTNRFLLEFPEDFNIDPWCIKSIKMPKIVKRSWEDTEILIWQLIPLTVHKNIMNMIGKTNFNINIKLLDPIGVVVGGWEINIKKVKSIDFGGVFSYSNDEIAKTTIILKTKNCKFTY